MRLYNPRIESRSTGETVVACDVLIEAGPEVYAQGLCFTVRLDRVRVEQLLIEVGLERAIWFLWTHFRRLGGGPPAIDSEHASLEDWATAVERLLTDVRQTARWHNGDHASP